MPSEEVHDGKTILNRTKLDKKWFRNNCCDYGM